MAYPSWSTFPGLDLFPGPEEPITEQTAMLPPSTLEELMTGARKPSVRVIATNKDERATELTVLDGSLSDSWDGTPRRELSLELPRWEEYLTLLHPSAGSTVRAFFSVSGSDAKGATWLMGTFVPVKVEEASETLQVALVDLSHRVRGRLMAGPMQPTMNAQGKLPLHEAVAQVLQARAPWVTIATPEKASPMLTVRPTLGDVAADPWDACQKLCETQGYHMSFNREGQVAIEPITDPLIAPVAAVWQTGSEGVLLSLKRSLDGNDAPEACLVRWDGGVVIVPEDAGRLMAWDGDETLVKTAEDAKKAGEAALALKRGIVEAIDVSVYPRFDVQAGNVVRVEDARRKFSMTARILSVSWDLSLTSMAVKLSDRRDTTGG